MVSNLSQSEIKEILTNHNVIAVVGLSRDLDKPSHEVAQYLKMHGYRIIPVNPFAEQILGEKSYRRLLDLPAELQEAVEIVDVFRRSEDVPPIVEQAIQLSAKRGKPLVVWMQKGIVNEAAAEKARQAGLTVIMDKCLMVEHRRI